MTIVGSTDLISTSGMAACAVTGFVATVITVMAMKGTLKHFILPDQSMCCHYFRGVRFCNALEQKSSAVLGDDETQLQVRALPLDLRWLGIKQQVGLR